MKILDDEKIIFCDFKPQNIMLTFDKMAILGDFGCAFIMLKDGEPFIHAHITISDHSLNGKGGHLFEAKVAAVGEFILRKINADGKREFDSNIGLACMAFN